MDDAYWPVLDSGHDVTLENTGAGESAGDSMINRKPELCNSYRLWVDRVESVLHFTSHNRSDQKHRAADGFDLGGVKAINCVQRGVGQGIAPLPTDYGR